MNEVVITGIKDDDVNKTTINISSYDKQQLENRAPYNLSDALAKVPGISQMNTGNSISKPVIRGLYGNRILVLLSGLRFDNQQFQDEHGLGLSQIGIDRVEVIKGPASILYGTDAIGGVINIIEETPTVGSKLDATTRLYSNTFGTLTDIGYSLANKKKWLRIRGGIETNADYTDGSGFRVLNSRNNGYYLKAGTGFNHKKWQQNNSYSTSYNQYGFIMDSLTKLYVHDGRWSRGMQGPHHYVLLNIISSQNTFKLPTSTLKLNIGAQSNKRAEDEGGGQISLNMHLLSILENAKWEKQLNKQFLFVANQQFTFENNKNYGKRILIPDANIYESNISAFIRYTVRKINIEAGIGYNYKQLITYKTKSLNSGNNITPDTTILPFNKGTGVVNSMLGLSYSLRNFNIKANIATGNRAANLAELSSNGLHEGTYRVEIGNPNLKMEQNINSDISLEKTSKSYSIAVSGFYNRILNYIYLTKTNELQWIGFDKYRYVQQNATLYGGEAIASLRPLKSAELKETFTMTEGILDNGNYLPFIPAYKLRSSVKFEHTFSKSVNGFFIEPELEYSFAQNKPANFETKTPDYMLANIYVGLQTHIKNNTITWNLSCRNMFNKQYADHLSRIKYYGFYNQGINFILSVKVNIG
jgi:iron complex outermembrane receptor protein